MSKRTMSLRTQTPPPFRPPTLADAVTAPSHEHRQLFLEHVRVSEKLRAAQWKKASDVTVNRRAPISTPSKPKVGSFR